jgi:hypothetical protein
MDSVEEKLRHDVQQFGWHVMNVLPEGEHPPHSYSIGLFATYGHPEIVVVGLPGNRAHHFINNLADEIKDGATFEAGSRYRHVIEGFDVMFLRVEPAMYREHFGRALDYYGGLGFPVVQMVWPDRHNVFPWERSCDAGIRDLQPVLARRPN